MSKLGASQLELALEIGEGDIDVAHGHGRMPRYWQEAGPRLLKKSN
jgi:hypothetical protein